jgi:hypothetical protein
MRNTAPIHGQDRPFSIFFGFKNRNFGERYHKTPKYCKMDNITAIGMVNSPVNKPMVAAPQKGIVLAETNCKIVLIDHAPRMAFNTRIKTTHPHVHPEVFLVKFFTISHLAFYCMHPRKQDAYQPLPFDLETSFAKHAEAQPCFP